MTSYRSHRPLDRAALAAAFALTAALLVTACGGHSDAGGDDHGGGHGESHDAGKSTDERGNAADVSFAQGMIPHHRQAVEMARLAPSRASSGQVKSLAEDIGKAQRPEIRAMSGWLEAWHAKVPGDSSEGDHSEHSGGHSGPSMPGMMTLRDMAQLKDETGKQFDKAFLEMMVEHHKGAVAMARTEESKGAHGASMDMARDIERSQTAEIAKMRGLLKE